MAIHICSSGESGQLRRRENLTAFGWRTPEEPRAAKVLENPRFSTEPLFREEGFLLS